MLRFRSLFLQELVLRSSLPFRFPVTEHHSLPGTLIPFPPLSSPFFLFLFLFFSGERFDSVILRF
jgi:hypothetical protein